MKNIYIGYYTKTPHEMRDMWDNGLITFDHHVLLNFYRLARATRDHLTDLIRKLSDKIFLTHHAGLEFHKKRFEIIAEQKEEHGLSYNRIAQAQTDIQANHLYPFLNERTRYNLLDALEEVKKELALSVSYYDDLLVEDEIFVEIEKLFEHKVERGGSQEEDRRLFEAKQVEPGWTLEDFCLWKQIVSKAKKTRKNIILVSDEKKSTWSWKLQDAKTVIGPRQELSEEMHNEARTGLLIYTVREFMEYSASYLLNSRRKETTKKIEEWV